MLELGNTFLGESVGIWPTKLLKLRKPSIRTKRRYRAFLDAMGISSTVVGPEKVVGVVETVVFAEEISWSGVLCA